MREIEEEIGSDLIDAAMLISTLWGVTSSVMSLFYAGMQVMVPCLPPAPLSTAVIYTDEYMGSWYFVAAAAWDEDELKAFKNTDSSVLHIEKGADDTLTVTETSRVGHQCHKSTWSYFASSATAPFLFRSDRNEKTPDGVVQEFKSKMECVYMEDFIKAPLKKVEGTRYQLDRGGNYSYY
ncbi:Apolipoprotein M [Labeo rohita]|uniref:Apolipoprotein M n=1 Tax=Labeo rohita TaxID=84645 RepID=A0ABQ8MYB7_LABRO|nr:Apolipoprotein M [Labeo rohita]